MILNYAVQKEASADTGMAAWLAKLQEGKKSTQQIQSEMLESTTENLKDIQEKAAEKIKEAAKQKTEAAKEDSSAEDTETTTSTDEIKAPSEVTAQDLESPIDIKL